MKSIASGPISNNKNSFGSDNDGLVDWSIYTFLKLILLFCLVSVFSLFIIACILHFFVRYNKWLIKYKSNKHQHKFFLKIWTCHKELPY